MSIRSRRRNNTIDRRWLIFEANATCADRPSVAQVIVRLLEALTHKSADLDLAEVSAKYAHLVEEVGETTELVIFNYYRAVSLMFALKTREAHKLMVRSLAIAERTRRWPSPGLRPRLAPGYDDPSGSGPA